MAISSKIYKLETPKSEGDSAWEDFEYMLAWIGDSGGVNQWLFYDREIQHDTQGQQVNLDDSELIGTSLREQGKKIVITAEDLTEDEFDYVSSISRSSTVWRVYKDGTTEKLSIGLIDFNYVKSERRYEFEITLNEKNVRVQR